MNTVTRFFVKMFTGSRAAMAVLLGTAGLCADMPKAFAADNAQNPVVPSCALPSTEVSLSQYPLLSQKDPANYRDQSLMSAMDTSVNGKKEAVQNLACAATVYVMIERGRGNAKSMVDDFYDDPRKKNGDGDGATRPTYVGADEAWSPTVLIEEMQAKHPVVLHAHGGVLADHFMLAVGLNKDSSGNWQVIVSDPWPGNKRDTPGRTVMLPLQPDPPVHPLLSGCTITQLRKVASASETSQAAKPVIPTPSSTASPSPSLKAAVEATLTSQRVQAPASASNNQNKFSSLLNEESTVSANPGKDEFIATVSWMRRVGAWKYTARMSALDFQKTEVETMLDGGPFKYCVIVRVPIRSGNQVLLQIWGPEENPTGDPWEKSTPPKTEKQVQDAIQIYARGPSEAQKLVTILRGYAGTTSGNHSASTQQPNQPLIQSTVASRQTSLDNEIESVLKQLLKTEPTFSHIKVKLGNLVFVGGMKAQMGDYDRQNPKNIALGERAIMEAIQQEGLLNLVLQPDKNGLDVFARMGDQDYRVSLTQKGARLNISQNPNEAVFEIGEVTLNRVARIIPYNGRIKKGQEDYFLAYSLGDWNINILGKSLVTNLGLKPCSTIKFRDILRRDSFTNQLKWVAGDWAYGDEEEWHGNACE
ncbi:MAG: hypothetical protein WCH57_01370 [Verrucomicrobiota bacterium]